MAGAWVNAANDWGHPQFINWLWPPARSPSDPEYDNDDPRTWHFLLAPGLPATPDENVYTGIWGRVDSGYYQIRTE